MCILLCTNVFSFAQTLEVQAQASYCYIAGQPLPISEFVVISGDSNEQLEGIQVTIENYDASTDLLAYNGTAVNSNFDSSNGILTLNGHSYNWTVNGSDAPEGKYSYFASWVIEANNITSTEEVRGEFKLIR